MRCPPGSRTGNISRSRKRSTTVPRRRRRAAGPAPRPRRRPPPRSRRWPGCTPTPPRHRGRPLPRPADVPGPRPRRAAHRRLPRPGAGRHRGHPPLPEQPDHRAVPEGGGALRPGAEPARRALAGGARPVLVEGPLDAIAVTCAGGGRYAGVAPCGTGLTAAQVAVLDTHAGPLADRGVIAAFDHDPGGRQAALRAYELLAATGAWPTTASLPEGQDPAGLAQHAGPGALRAALDADATPLADLVVDERLARWSDRLRWVEGQLGAARDAAGLIATLPPDQIGRQVLRVANRLGLDPADLTRAVVDAQH